MQFLWAKAAGCVTGSTPPREHYVTSRVLQVRVTDFMVPTRPALAQKRGRHPVGQLQPWGNAAATPTPKEWQLS